MSCVELTLTAVGGNGRSWWQLVASLKNLGTAASHLTSSLSCCIVLAQRHSTKRILSGLLISIMSYGKLYVKILTFNGDVYVLFLLIGELRRVSRSGSGDNRLVT